VRILLTVDEGTYTGATMGDPHPISWSHAYSGGRAWYTAMGHTVESYTEPIFLQHLAGGILLAAGLR
jgi:type 1 glutamine amidotransferase